MKTKDLPVKAGSRPELYRFTFTDTEACFLCDGLNTLVDEGERDWERLEDGEKEEIVFAKKLAQRIGKKIGVE